MICQECGHDLTGDEEEFVSGGGPVVDISYDDGEQITEYRCPNCRRVMSSDINPIRR